MQRLAHSKSYFRAVAAHGAWRVDLNSWRVAPVDDEHRQYAAATLMTTTVAEVATPVPVPRVTIVKPSPLAPCLAVTP